MMLVFNTHKWRRAMEGYRRDQGLGKEEGFTVETAKPLGKPARRLLRRIQKNMLARKLIKLEDVDGTLNEHTQNILLPPLTMGDKAIAYAMTQIGVHESPWGSNSGADVTRYQTSTGAYHTFWCASFVWYCWQKAGYKGPTSAGAWYTTDHIGLKVLLKAAKPGDPVSFNIGDGHVGLYTHHDSQYVYTIDGNTDNQVANRKRSINLIHSICKPV